MLMLAISISFCPLTMLLTKGLDTGQEAPQGVSKNGYHRNHLHIEKNYLRKYHEYSTLTKNHRTLGTENYLLDVTTSSVSHSF